MDVMVDRCERRINESNSSRSGVVVVVVVLLLLTDWDGKM